MALVPLLHVGAMTGRALGSGRLVEENTFGIDETHFFVTGFAAHIAMHALQRKPGELVMIEKRRLPLGGVVAIGASGNAHLCELLPVRIFVALFARLRSSLEVHMEEPGLEIRGLVAIDAGGGFVCPEQREVSLGMIESGQLSP